MSTPLGNLIRSVLTDPDATAAFTSAPEAFLAEHGYAELEPEDVREALYVLADGSPPDTAARLVAGGDSLAELGGEGHGLGAAASGLLGALHAAAAVPESIDPSDLDGWDDDSPADGGRDEHTGGERDDGDDDEDDDGVDRTDHRADHHADGGTMEDAADVVDGSETTAGVPIALDADDVDAGTLQDADDADEPHPDEFDDGFDLRVDDPGAPDLDPFASLPDAIDDVSPLVADTTQPLLLDDEPGDGWDDVI